MRGGVGKEKGVSRSVLVNPVSEPVIMEVFQMDSGIGKDSLALMPANHVLFCELGCC
jgi:hypothetical protein